MSCDDRVSMMEGPGVFTQLKVVLGMVILGLMRLTGLPRQMVRTHAGFGP